MLRTRLHGQHLVRPVVVKSLRAHLRNPNPQKALALSFHGWTGTGKNFVSGMITNHLYHRGRDSQYVHLFAATHHFPHESHIETYKVSFHYDSCNGSTLRVSSHKQQKFMFVILCYCLVSLTTGVFLFVRILFSSC